MSTQTIQKSDFIEACIAAGGDAAPLPKLREEAAAAARALGLPHTKLEEWRNTSVRVLSETEFDHRPSAAAPSGILRSLPMQDAEIRLVFVNGRLDEALSSVPQDLSGAYVGLLRNAPESVQERLLSVYGTVADWRTLHFVALNTACAAECAVLWVPTRAALARPVHIIHLGVSSGKPAASHPRLLCVLDEAAEATVVETFAVPGDQVAFLNSVTEIKVAADARLFHSRLQLGSEKALHISSLQANCADRAKVEQTTFTYGGALVRNDTGSVLDGEAAETTLNALYIARNEQHVDNHTTLDHAKPNCPSFEMYKGIVDDKASAVFRGRIIVRPDAQKTDSKQSNMNLILSDDAVINSKPQLEIFADDVRCTHGATIGRIDDEPLFYLRSRGIDAKAARHLLTFAFASEVLDAIQPEQLKNELEALIFARFAAGDTLPSSDDLHS